MLRTDPTKTHMGAGSGLQNTQQNREASMTVGVKCTQSIAMSWLLVEKFEIVAHVCFDDILGQSLDRGMPVTYAHAITEL